MCRHAVLRLLVVGLVLIFATGCRHVRRGAVDGLASVVEDVTDVVRADVSFSFGSDMGGHVMATKFARLASYSYENVYRVGLNARTLGVWEDDREDDWIGPWPIKWGHSVHNSQRAEAVCGLGVGYIGRYSAGTWAIEGMVGEQIDEFGFGIHLFIIGFRVGVRPAEFVDLLTNFVGWDMLGDNERMEPFFGRRWMWLKRSDKKDAK